MNRVFLLGVFLAVFLTAPWGWAQHQHGGMPGMTGLESEKRTEPAIGNETSSRRAFLLEGGAKASFSITAMADYRKMLQDMKMKVEVDPQATHNIAVTLTATRSNLAITGAVVKMKIITPAGKEQTKLLDFIQAMNQYAGDFTLSEKGKYQILILFKSNEEKYPAGFYYILK